MEWEAFVRATIDRVHSLLYRMTGHREEAEDLVQEAYLRAYRSWERFRGDANPATWVYGIALNLGRDEIARRRVARAREGGEVDPEFHAASTPDPEARAVAEEDRRHLARALAALAPEHREVLLLAEVEGLSMEETAAALGAPVGTAKSRLFRARAALREELIRTGWR